MDFDDDFDNAGDQQQDGEEGGDAGPNFDDFFGGDASKDVSLKSQLNQFWSEIHRAIPQDTWTIRSSFWSIAERAWWLLLKMAR